MLIQAELAAKEIEDLQNVIAEMKSELRAQQNTLQQTSASVPDLKQQIERSERQRGLTYFDLGY